MEQLGFAEDTGGGDGDVLKPDAGEVARLTPIAVLRIGFGDFHADEELLQGGPRVFDVDVAEDDTGARLALPFPAHVEDAPPAPVVPLGAGVNDIAIFHDERAIRQLRRAAEDEGRAIGIVPEHAAADAEAIDVQRIVLGAQEAVLDERVAERIDAVAIGAPCEDLRPPHLVGVIGLVRMDEHKRMRGRVRDGDAFHLGVGGADQLDGPVEPVLVLLRRRVRILGVLQPGTGQRAVAEDADMMRLAPLLIRQSAVDDGIAGDIVAAVRPQPERQPDIMHARQEVERGPRPVGRRALARFHCQDAGVARRGLVREGRIGEDR